MQCQSIFGSIVWNLIFTPKKKEKEEENTSIFGAIEPNLILIFTHLNNNNNNNNNKNPKCLVQFEMELNFHTGKIN
jgi:hypothetical protein